MATIEDMLITIKSDYNTIKRIHPEDVNIVVVVNTKLYASIRTYYSTKFPKLCSISPKPKKKYRVLKAEGITYFREASQLQAYRIALG